MKVQDKDCRVKLRRQRKEKAYLADATVRQVHRDHDKLDFDENFRRPVSRVEALINPNLTVITLVSCRGNPAATGVLVLVIPKLVSHGQ